VDQPPERCVALDLWLRSSLKECDVTTTVQAKPENRSLAGAPNPELILNVFPERDSCTVHVAGELDLATRKQLLTTMIAGNHPTMVIDLAGVTFMDCSGYGSLVASQLAVEGGGRTLTIIGQTGQPARLLELIAELESTAASLNSHARV
jgi:anti-anti-sigma factor